MDIGSLLEPAATFGARLAEVKASLAPEPAWYPYGTLSNLWHLDRLLGDGHRDLSVFIGDRPVADIGGADGDLAFFLAEQGVTVDIVDYAPTNWNGLRGARMLADHLGPTTAVTVHDIDLDSQFRLPRERYGLVLLLGILYHLQNPFYVLRHLAERTDYLLLSTRVARVTADGRVRLDDAPVAYLVDPTETNDDPTNYWMFSPPGLRRLVARTGWTVLDEVTVGHTAGDSDPARADRDERAFHLLRSDHVRI
jgi:tRNA (mo5U34)-methyltransferase